MPCHVRARCSKPDINAPHQLICLMGLTSESLLSAPPKTPSRPWSDSVLPRRGKRCITLSYALPSDILPVEEEEEEEESVSGEVYPSETFPG